MSKSNNGQTTYFFSDEEKIESLNNCFTSITNVDDSNIQLPAFQAKAQNLLSDMSYNTDEIEILIKLLNPNKAIAPDAFSNRMLIAVAKEISIPLSVFLTDLSEKENLHFRRKNQRFSPYLKRGISLFHPIID